MRAVCFIDDPYLPKTMRHRHGFRKLGTDHVHRKALLKNMAIALIKHERIMTTLPKAKELRRVGDKVGGAH